MNHLGLFAKFWKPKTVKTRLAAGIGDVLACAIYRDFVFHLLVRHLGSCDTRTVVLSPPERERDFREVLPNDWGWVPQVAGDLGVRMRSFFEFQFARCESFGDQADSKVIVIGTDCPQLDGDVIESALLALDGSPVVLGPSTDGGYYLIGMRSKCFAVFSNIDWSTSRVLEQTVERLDERRVDYSMLDPLTDIDEKSDLEELESFLQCRERQGRLDELDSQLLIRVKLALSGVSSEESD